jgi:uncharacterized protein (TIGR03437 family)
MYLKPAAHACLTVLLSALMPARAQTAATTVSAASFSSDNGVAPNSMVSTFGSGLATKTENATTQPLPTNLGGTTVSITDSAGATILCPLVFVSPGQVNHLIPENTAVGKAVLHATSGDGRVSENPNVVVNAAAIGFFAANGDGAGPAAGYVTLRHADHSPDTVQEIAVFDPVSQRHVSQPIDLGGQGDEAFFTLFGTGLRKLTTTTIALGINGSSLVTVLYVGAQGEFAGLDQLNAGPITSSDFPNPAGELKLSALALSPFQMSNVLSFRLASPKSAPIFLVPSTDTGIQGQTIRRFQVFGEGLYKSTLAFSPADGITVSNLSTTDTTLTADLAISESSAAGVRNLTVASSGGAQASPVSFTIRDKSSTDPYLSNLLVGSTTVSFDFTEPGGNLKTGSLLLTAGRQYTYPAPFSVSSGTSSQTSDALLKPGQTSGTIRYSFSPPLQTTYSYQVTQLIISVQDAAGKTSNKVAVRVQDDNFNWQSIPNGH